MIETKSVVICDRCNKVAGTPPVAGDGFTMGYYDADARAWGRFANPGEKHICDSCMWDDPRYIAVYGRRQPAAVAVAKEFRYGDNKTVHGTTLVNVETDPKSGEVVAVWFRCLNLPFDQYVVGPSRAREMREMYARQNAAPVKAHIKAVVFEERPNG